MSVMNSAICVQTWFRSLRGGELSAARRIRSPRLGRLRCAKARVRCHSQRTNFVAAVIDHNQEAGTFIPCLSSPSSR
jgi:hypothetical protein